MSNRGTAVQVVLSVLEDLHDRSGIGNEIEIIDSDIYSEMVEDLTNIVEKVLDE